MLSFRFICPKAGKTNRKKAQIVYQGFIIVAKVSIKVNSS